jgi:tetratricopeptide (TPR) repeat protein
MKNFENDQLVKRAISYLRLGNTAEAKQILAACVKDNPEDANAWLGLAKCVNDDERVRFCLDKVLTLDARNAEAKAALRRLRGGKEPFPELIEYHRRRKERNRPKLESERKPRQERRSFDVQKVWKDHKSKIMIGGVIIVVLIIVGIISIMRGLKAVEADVIAPTAAVLDDAVPDGAIGGEMNAEPDGQATALIPTAEVGMLPANWMKWPVVPEVSEQTKGIYRQGMKLGRDAKAFSIIGDCHSAPEVLFERLVDPEYTRPAEYGAYLETIGTYSESWGRYFVTVKNGMSAASVLSPYWNDEEICEADESPLACEIRLHNPSIIIISIGTNWLEEDYEPFEEYYRKVLDEIIAQGIVPVITTKADPTAADFPLNMIMARLAYEYELPMWNFWSAVQDLPDHGLDVDYEEGHHLLHAAWDVKRLTGVQVMDALQKELKDEVPLVIP